MTGVAWNSVISEVSSLCTGGPNECLREEVFQGPIVWLCKHPVIALRRRGAAALGRWKLQISKFGIIARRVCVNVCVCVCAGVTFTMNVYWGHTGFCIFSLMPAVHLKCRVHSVNGLEARLCVCLSAMCVCVCVCVCVHAWVCICMLRVPVPASLRLHWTQSLNGPNLPCLSRQNYTSVSAKRPILSSPFFLSLQLIAQANYCVQAFCVYPDWQIRALGCPPHKGFPLPRVSITTPVNVMHLAFNVLMTAHKCVGTHIYPHTFKTFHTTREKEVCIINGWVAVSCECVALSKGNDRWW